MAFNSDYRIFSAQAATGTAVDMGLRSYMLRIYNWMASGLLLTGIVAYGVANSTLIGLFYRAEPNAYGHMMMRPTGLGFVTMLAPLGFVLALQFGINRLSRPAAQALFWAFCATMGLSLTNIFLVYTQTSVVRVFMITAGAYAGLSLLGYTTRRDLTGLGGFLAMGVIGLVLASLFSMFFPSTMLQFVISVGGVLIFAALTVYDTQRIKNDYSNYAYAMGPDGVAMRSIFDALTLYLNFINLFMFLLQFLGNRNSD